MKQQYLQTGKIVSTHGVHGEVKLLPWADSPEFLLQFHTLYLDGKPFRVEQSRVQKTCVLVKLAGVDTVEAGAALRDKIVSIDRADAKLPEGSVFIADLLGLPVYDGETLLGKLTEVMSTPANDVYVVKGDTVTIVSSLNGNVIVKVKESRVAISEEMARKIMI